LGFVVLLFCALCWSPEENEKKKNNQNPKPADRYLIAVLGMSAAFND